MVATYPKSGTTLTQQVCLQLVTGGDPAIFGGDQKASPWIDFRATPDAREVAERQTRRRVMKTHLPLQHLVFSPKARYVAVARDPRDVAWSWHNHVSNFTDGFRAERPHLAAAPSDVRTLYHAFIDGPGQPHDYWMHIQGWWDARSLPNVLLLHYAELLADLPGVIRRIAAFLDIPVDESRFDRIVAHCRPDHMRRVGADDPFLNYVFNEGSTTFINKAVNGRWRDMLDADEIAKADAAALRELTPDCAAWLMSGGAGLGQARQAPD